MAAILSNDETRDFNRFLEAFDASDSSEAAIIGGAELVIRRGQGWDGAQPAGSYSTAGNGYQRPPPAPAASYAPTTSAPLPYHHAPTPSSYAPPPQHIARPTYPISYATPPSHMGFAPPPPPPNPYPSAPLETLDQDRLERMAKQARELSDWVGVNNEGGTPIPHAHRAGLVRASSGERPEQGDEGRRSDGCSSLMPEGLRHNGGRRGYSHERPPLMYPSGDGSSGTEDTMQRMREAEERLSFARRVKEANYEPADPQVHHQTRVEQPPTTIIDYNSYNEPTPIHPPQAMAFAPPPPRSRRARDPSPPPQHYQPQEQSQPELVISAPTPAPSTKRKAGSSATATNSKAAPRASTSTAPPPNDTEFDTDPALNPAPFSTPSNIPPSPFPPPPRAVRPRPSPSTSATSASTSTSTPVPTTSGGKPALLSAEQKKANHIASEQKRRAAIRQGYEALCTVVPSLKAAVEEFEERVKKLGGAGGGGRAGKKRRGSGGAAMAGPLSGGIEVGGEKVDGRAGPKSEAVVLGKTVEHLRNLLSERQALLERLSSLYQLAEDSDLEVEGGRRMWEEHWDGGPVLTGNAVEEAEDGDEDEM